MSDRDDAGAATPTLFRHRLPTREQIAEMPTDELSALANRLGVGRWIMDENRSNIVAYLQDKVELALIRGGRIE